MYIYIYISSCVSVTEFEPNDIFLIVYSVALC